MRRLRSLLQLGSTVFLALTLLNGCAAATGDESETSEERLRAATCGLDPKADASPRTLLDEPFRTAADAEKRLGCLQVILRAQDDGRAPFATLYSTITVSAHDAIRDGRFEDNVWVERYLVRFAELYREAYVGYVDGRADAIPASWRISFDTAREGRALAVQHVALGVNAHVNRDLSHTLVDVGLGDGEVRESHKRDHFKVNDILRENLDKSIAVLSETYAPGLGEAPDAVLEVMKQAYFAFVAGGRFKAWQDAVLLEASGPFDGLVDGQIELTSKLVAKAILLPSMSDPVLDKLHQLEGTSQ